MQPEKPCGQPNHKVSHQLTAQNNWRHAAETPCNPLAGTRPFGYGDTRVEPNSILSGANVQISGNQDSAGRWALSAPRLIVAFHKNLALEGRLH